MSEKMPKNVKILLKKLAEKYETEDFYKNDPSQFIHLGKNQAQTEKDGFISAMMSFGSRKQFIPKISEILNGYDFSNGGKEKFYRFYSYDDIKTFLEEIDSIMQESGTLGNHFKKIYKNQAKTSDILLPDIISSCFPKSKIVSKGKNSANKRINMYCRWMVRQNSPVDTGFWNWYPTEKLIMPIDVHVLKESIKLGLLPENAKADKKNAILLTQKMKEIWPSDPVKGDFALFGLGVN